MSTRLVTIVLVLLCSSSVLRAQTPDEAKPLEVRQLKLVGVDAIDESRLRAVLRTEERSWLPWKKDRPFDRGEFQADLRRIVAYYRDHGFRNARVVSSDAAVDAARREVSITIAVEEGTPVLLGAVRLAGFDMLSAGEQDQLRDRLPLATGEPLVYPTVLASAEQAATELQDRGYPDAKVRVREEPAGPDSLTVIFDLDPGTQAVFGPVEISGNVSVGDEIIRRELTYRPGELYRRSLLQDSQRRLYSLALFRFVAIETIAAAGTRADVATRVTVVEGDHRKIDVSFGYGTEEKVRGELGWRNVNFFGGARTLGVRTRWSSLERGGQLDFVQPYLLRPNLRFAMDGHYWRASEPAYTQTARGGRAALSGDFNRTTSWSLTLKGENQASEVAQAALADPSLRDDLIALGLNPDTGRQSGLLTSLALGAQRSTVENALDPQRGYHVSVHLEQAGSWLPGRFEFVEWQIGGRYYLPVTDSVVAAARLQIATIDPSGASAALPFARRYFLGGSTSLRGWGRYQVSPLSASGLPLGGNSMLESAAEIRARLSGPLGVVAFVDAGNVWPVEWQYDLKDLRADAGLGLRYYTPVGPLRLDAAWQLTPIAGLRTNDQLQMRRWRLHFSIGQAF